jgi:hypothetical protein
MEVQYLIEEIVGTVLVEHTLFILPRMESDPAAACSVKFGNKSHNEVADLSPADLSRSASRTATTSKHSPMSK